MNSSESSRKHSYMKSYMDELVRSIDKNMIKNPVAYCKTHKGYLSRKQMKIHQCVPKNCTGLKKIDCPYWEERQRRKREAKERKKQYGENSNYRGNESGE